MNHGHASYHDYATDWIEEKAKENSRPQFSIEGINGSKNQVDEAKTHPLRLPKSWKTRKHWWDRITGFRKK